MGNNNEKYMKVLKKYGLIGNTGAAGNAVPTQTLTKANAAGPLTVNSQTTNPSATGVVPSKRVVDVLQRNGLLTSEFDKVYGLMTQYAQYGPAQVNQFANDLATDAASTYDKGDIKNFNWDDAISMKLFETMLGKELSKTGMFNNESYALNSLYGFLPQTSYLESLLGQRNADIEKWNQQYADYQSRNVAYGASGDNSDGAIEKFYSALQKSGALESGEYNTAQLLYIDSIVNGTGARPLSVFNKLSPEEQSAEIARMQKIATGVDWNAILNPGESTFDVEEYKTKTAALQSDVDTLQKEIDRRKALAEMETMLRSNPDFDALSAYQDTYTAPQGAAKIFGNDAFIQGLDDQQRFINAQTRYADRQLAGEYSGKVKQYLSMGLDMMTPAEIANYNVALSMGPEQAEAYLELLAPELNARRAEVQANYYTTRAGDTLAGAIDSAGTIITKPQGTFNTIWGAATGEYDPNAAIYDITRNAGITRSEYGEHLGKLAPFPIFGEEAGTVAYNILMSVGDMLMARGIGGMVGGLSNKAGVAQKVMGWTMASQSGADTYLSDLQNGKDPLYAAMHGIANGAVEMWSESGFIDSLFDDSGKFLTRVAKSAAAEGMEEWVSEGGQMAVDLFLSYMTGQENEIQQTYKYYEATLGKDKAAAATLENYANNFAIAGLSGFASGGGTSFVTNTATEINNRQTGKAVQQQGDPERMVEIAKSMDPSSEAYQIATEIETSTEKGKKMSLGKLGRLTQAMGNTLGEQYADLTNGVMNDAITERLIELGSDPEAARRNADVIRKIGYGLKVTVQERAGLIWDKYADQVAREVAQGMHTVTKGVASISKGIEDAKQGVRDAVGGFFNQMENSKAVDENIWSDEQIGGQTGDSILDSQWVDRARVEQFKKSENVEKQIQDFQSARTFKKNVSTAVQEAKKNAAGKVRKGKNGKAAGKANSFNIAYDNGNGIAGEGELEHIERTEDGKLQMVIKNGDEKVNVDIGDFTQADGEGTATLLESIKYINDNLHDVSPEEANAMLQSYKAGGGDAGRFVESYETLYLRGFSGVDGDTTLPPTDLDGTLAKIAVESGRRQAEAEEANRLERVAKARKIETPTVGWLGDVTDNTQIRGWGDTKSLDEAVKGMTDGQRYVVEYGKALAEKAHINVVFFNSKADKSGKFTADNGRYDPNTHTIYLDVNAGLNDSHAIKAAKKAGTLGYAMMRTLGHEVTHAIESTSAEYYAKYKQAVKNALKAKGQDWAMLVRARIDEALAGGQKMTYAEAESEIVADASEYMLQDADFTKDLDKGIVAKIKTVVKKFVTTINDIFRELGKTGSIESYTLREMQDGVYRYMDGLQELWGAAFEEMQSGGMKDGVDDALYETGEIYSYTAQSSARVRDKKTIADLETQQHITTYRAMQVINGELYPPMAEFIGSKKGGNREDPGVIGQWEMAVEHPELIKWVNGKPKFELKKTNDDGSVSTVPAAYNPYMHSSNTVLNDQFSKAFQRTNLVVVECVVPVSESDGAYHAQYAKDATGWHEWKSGVVAGDLAKQKSGFRRDVFLSRYIKPVRILPDSEVAEKIAGYLEGTDVTVPFQCAWPTLRDALVQEGVNVTEPRGLGPAQMKIAREAFEEWKRGNKMQSSPRKNNGFDRAVEVHYTQNGLDQALTRDESLLLDDRLHYRIHYPENGKEIEVGSDFAETVTFHGDQTKLVVMRRDTQIDVSVLAVYNVNIKGYNGHITDLTREYEEAIRKHGAEWFKRWYGSFLGDDQKGFLERYDRDSGAFIRSSSSGTIYQGTQKASGSSGVRSNRAGDAGSGEVTSPDGVEVDNKTGSAHMQSSARTWYESDYVTKREETAQRLAKTLKVSLPKVRKWIDDVTSIAAYVLDNKARVDYIPTAVKGISAFKSNPEYGGSIDMSTICAKRRLATGTLDAIQRVLGDEVLTKDDFLRIREMMKERDHEVACGLCFVESSRKNLSKYNAQFMEQYNSTHPDGEISMTDLNTVDGLEALRLNNEGAYAEYEKFMNKLAQRKPKLFEKRTEYEHEILKKFKNDTTVGVKNRNGGLRLQSFSNFEIVHLIDMMQVITDMASVGLAGQAYTKVPDFAWALGNTGLKINLSLIAKGVDADGNLIFDDVEGMPYKEAKKLRDYYSENVGTVVVTFTDEQLIAAMKNDFVDYIIPFHRSQWQKVDYKKLGLPEGTKDYTLHQNEKKGRKRVPDNFLPNAYWRDDLSGDENAAEYLDMCEKDGRTPKFAKFLSKDADGHWVAPSGYWKLLIDFKMYDNNGNGSRQMPVQPNFNMEQAMRMLEEYKGEHDSFPVAQDVVEDFVQEYRDSKGGVQKTGGQYTVNPMQRSARRGTGNEITTRDYLAESDDSIAETVEERNALTIYQQRLKEHAETSEAVIAAEEALIGKEGQALADARAALAKARNRQNELYRRLLKVENTEHVRKLTTRTQQFVNEDLYGKTSDDVAKMISAQEAEIANLKADLTGLKGAAKTQREADIRQHERIVARFKSKAAQMVLENSEKYQRQIADIRLRRDINIEIGKKTRHIKRVVKVLNDRIVHEEDYKNVKEPIKPAVHTLVRTFVDGFGNLVFDQKTADRLRGVYDAIADENAAPDFYSDDVANWLSDLASMKELDAIIRAEGSSSLSAAEEKLVMYSRVADIADHIYKMVTDADEIFINGKRASIAAVSGEVGDALVAKPDKPLLVGKARDAARIADDLLRTGNMTPQYFFDHLKNSGLTKLFDGLMDGQQQYAQAIREGQEAVAAAKDKYNFYSWQNMKEGVEFRTEQGHLIALTVPQMMWVYATAKREATNTLMDTHHLDQGGFRYERNALPREKGKMTAIPGSDKLHKLSAKDVAKITDTLTAEQKACADELVGYLSEDCAEMGNEASMKLFGIKKYNEEYYFPFKTAGDQRYQRSDAGSTSTTNDARVKHASFTHSLRKGANTPLVMGDFFDVIADHINMMATYSSFVVPIESMNRVLNTKVNEDADGNGNNVTIRSLVGAKYGEPAQKYIADLMKDLNGGPRTDNRGGISALFRAFKRGAVMGSLSVTLQQPTAVARAMAYVNPKYFLHLTGEGNKKTWERMMRYSGTAVIKDMGKFDVGTGKMANDWIANSDLQSYNVWKRGKFLLHTEGWNAVKNNYVDFITALPGVMDRVTWTHIWKAIEAEQADMNPSMDRNSDDFLTAVGKRFDDVINHTQVYDSILAKSQNMRSKNPLTQMSTAFMSEPTLNINMLYDAIRGEHSSKQRAGIITSVIASNILAAAMASLISAWNKDDDERKWGEKYLTEFANRAIESVNPLTMIPYISDLWSMANGYDIERTDLSVVKDVIEYTGKFFSNVHDPEKANTWRDYENFFGTIANLLGVPAKNISRDIRRVRNLIMTDKSAASGSSLRYSLLETITPFGLYESSIAAYYERLLAATKDGDKQEMYDLKDYLMSTKGVKEDTVRNGVVNAYKKEYLRGGITKKEAADFLYNNDLVKGATADKKRQAAFKKVDEWDEGSDDYSVYNTIFDAVKNGNSAGITNGIKELTNNGYVESDVVSSVRTLIRESYMEGTMSQSQVKTAYKSRFAPKNFDVNDQNDWYWLFKELDWGKKNGNSTDGYSNYIFLKDGFTKYNESTIRNAWNELTSHGYEDDDVKSYVRTYILKPMVQEGKITTSRATELLSRWASYKKNSDNIDKPKEWLESK